MRKKICVVIPCYNEERGITKVITNIPYKRLFHYGYEVEVLVIDNNSTDKTVERAKSVGAKVIPESNQGKGML